MPRQWFFAGATRESSSCLRSDREISRGGGLNSVAVKASLRRRAPWAEFRPLPPLLSTPNRLAVATCEGLCAADRFGGTNLRNSIRAPSGGTRNRFGAPGVWLF